MKLKPAKNVLGIMLSTFYSHSININFLFLPGTVLSGFLVYYILSDLLVVPLRISIPLAIILSALIYALTRYYCSNYGNKSHGDNRSLLRTRFAKNDCFYYPKILKKDTYSYENLLNVFFVFIYISLLVVVGVGSFDYYTFEITNNRVFIPWGQFFTSLADVLYLFASIFLCFFMPGYAIAKMLSSKDRNGITTSSLLWLNKLLPRFLVAYFLSLLITGLTVYIFAAEIDFAPIRIEQDAAGDLIIPFQGLSFLILFMIYSLTIIIFIMHQKVKIVPLLEALKDSSGIHDFKSRVSRLKNIFFLSLNDFETSSKVIVFSSLLALVVFYSYYLNSGGIVVDQWFHHGRALLIGSGNFKDMALSGADTVWNPPFFSSLLSGFFNLSDLPSVNAYVSINSLNIIPILSFYYFFTSWIPKDKRRASLMATTLFVLSSGFGWLYAVDLAIASPPSNENQPEISSADIMANATITTYDIGLPTTFINVGYPDITTPFTIIALPLGFTLLGIIGQIRKEEPHESSTSVSGKAKGDSMTRPNIRVHSLRLITKHVRARISTTLLLITGLSFLGILAHDEFYLFVIVGCIAIVLLCPRSNLFPYNRLFASFLFAIALVFLLDLFIAPTEYYIIRDIQGFPIIALSFSFVCFMWILYALRISMKIGQSVRAGKNIVVNASTKVYKIIRLEVIRRILVMLPGDASNNHTYHYHYDIHRFFKIGLSLAIVSFVSYMYLLTFMFWEQLSYDDILSHADLVYSFNVPWYLYPMKFGLTGLLGIAFLLSYLFRKFEKEISIFALVSVVALFAGPYYDEHRFSKYVMAGMASFAGLLVYKILIYQPSNPSQALSHSSTDASKLKLRTLINGIVLGAIVTFSSMSILMFAGFVELYTDVEDYNEGSRRDFPVQSEIQLIDFLQSELFNGSQVYNIAMPESEMDPTGHGLISKIYGFSALPREKLLQSPLSLNASSLEVFYKLLEYSDTKYIVLPKEYIDTYDKQTSLSYPMLFSLDNFPRAYENSNFLVLEVPPLSPPRPSSPSSPSRSVSLLENNSRNNDVALIYQKDAQEWLMPLLSSSNNNNSNSHNADNYFISTISNYENESLTSPSSLFDFAASNDAGRILLFDDMGINRNSTNDGKDSRDPLFSENKQGVTTIVLDSMNIGNIGNIIGIDSYNEDNNKRKDSIVLWSKPIPALLKDQQNDSVNVDYNNNNVNNNSVNYIEGSLRVLAENNTHGSNDAGILWKYGNDREYYLSLKGSGMELSQRDKQETNPRISNPNNQAEDIDQENEATKTKTSLLVQNQEIRRERGIWYNIKILMVDDSFINIYVDDMLRMQAPIRNSTATSSSTSISTSSSSSSIPTSLLPQSISRVGIRSSNNIAEIQPMKIGHISPPANHQSSTSMEEVQQPSSYSSNSSSKSHPYPSLASYIKEKKYERHYYPLSMLALSNANYDTFVEGDLSAFSKKYVVLPYDPPIIHPINDSSLKHPYYTDYKYSNNLVKYYLEYVKNGGNLVVLDSEYDFNTINNVGSINSDGVFAQLLSIKTENGSKFNVNRKATDPSANVENSSSASNFASIRCPSLYANKNSYETSTFIKNDNNCISDLDSSTSNQVVDPFVIAKSYGKGNIIYLGSAGYFNFGGKSSKNSFSTIGEVVNTLGLHLGSEERRDRDLSLFLMQPKDPTRITGDVSITRFVDPIRISSGQTTIVNGTSFSLPDSSSNDDGSSIGSSYNLSASSVTVSNDSSTDSSDDSMSTTLVGGSPETNHGNSESDITFKKAILKDLKLYGSYEVIVNSDETRRDISLPQPSSYNDYVEITIPTGFTVTVRLSESRPAYAEFAILTKDQSSYQMIKVHGGKNISSPDSHNSGNTANSILIRGNMIELRGLKTEPSGFTSIALLMKSPDIRIINRADGDMDPQQNIALSFKKNSPQGDKFDIKNGGKGFTNITARISYIDNYNQLHGTGIRKQFVTYLEEGLQVIRDDNSQSANQNNSIANIRLPGSISESAKQAGTEIAWQKAVSSTNVAVAAFIAIMTAVTIRVLRSRTDRLNV